MHHTPVTPRTLIAIPIYNEAKYVQNVLRRVLSIHDQVLVIDDGSTDATPELVRGFPVDVLRHGRNRGYGASMQSAFSWAIARGYDWVITMDCDEQHEPAAIPRFLEAAASNGADIISGSRYLMPVPPDARPPEDRMTINRAITKEINERLGPLLGATLTDSFCGFKAYRVKGLARLHLSETGYAFPMQFWAQAAAKRLRVKELPVGLIYNDPNRSFGAVLDDPSVRLAHYRSVLHHELAALARLFPPAALADIGQAGRAALLRCAGARGESVVVVRGGGTLPPEKTHGCTLGACACR